MASRYFAILGRAGLAALDTADLAAWAASNPLENDLVFDLDNPAFVYWDGSAAVRIELGAAQAFTWQYQYKNFTGATFTEPALIGVRPVAFYLNSNIRYYNAAGTPDPADEWSFDPLTGEIDIGTPFDGDSFIFEYQNPVEVTPTV